MQAWVRGGQVKIFYGKTPRNFPRLQKEIKIPIFPSKGSLESPHQPQLCLKDLELLVLLRLASTAFESVSFSPGKPGSQVWVKVSLLGGAEFCCAISQPMTRNKLKGKTISFGTSHVFWNVITPGK